MIQSVEGARAALPLLAFAVSRLWEKRDRDKKTLTRVGVRGDWRCGGRARPARRGHDGPDRLRATGIGPRDLPKPGHCPGHAGGDRPGRAAERRSRTAEGGGRGPGAARRRAAADLVRGGGRGRRAEPTPDRGGARVADQGVAAPRAVADRRTRTALSCGTSSSRPRICGRAGAAPPTYCGAAPRCRSTSCGGIATQGS